MTREEAIKWFEEEKEAAQRQVVAFEGCFKCFKSAHRKIVVYNEMAIAALREQESLEEKQATIDWISVEERLPEPFVSVLVYMPEERPLPTVHEGFLAREGVWYANHFDREPMEITHWMPLPEPPKEEV